MITLTTYRIRTERMCDYDTVVVTASEQATDSVVINILGNCLP